MKARVSVLLLAVVCVCACKREAAAPPTPIVAPAPRGAPTAPALAPAPAPALPVAERPPPVPKEVDTFAISSALQAYVEQRNVNPLTISDLNVLVREKYLPHLPPPPPGKKYVWNRNLSVTVADR